jgi:hypothetical protein
MKARVTTAWPGVELHGAVGDVTGYEDECVLVTLTIDGTRSPWRFLPSEVELIGDAQLARELKDAADKFATPDEIARCRFEHDANGSVAIDDGAAASRACDGGVWVAAWLRISE